MKLIGASSKKSCTLDPVSAYILNNCMDILLPVITEVVNLSLESSTMPERMKVGVLTPLLKKPSLDFEIFTNFRPISGLTFISKATEKVVASQLIDYLARNDLHELYQSAYKLHHSTETALLRLQNDILRMVDNGSSVILLLLDLSAAFDTGSRYITVKTIR